MGAPLVGRAADLADTGTGEDFAPAVVVGDNINSTRRLTEEYPRRLNESDTVGRCGDGHCRNASEPSGCTAQIVRAGRNIYTQPGRFTKYPKGALIETEIKFRRILCRHEHIDGSSAVRRCRELFAPAICGTIRHW